MTEDESGADQDQEQPEGERSSPDDEFKRRLAFASMFFGGLFLERLMSEKEEVTTKDGRKITIRHSLFDEIFGWPDEKEKHGTQPPKEEPEPAIVVEPQETQRPLRRPPRKRKKPQSQTRPSTVRSTKNWPRY